MSEEFRTPAQVQEVYESRKDAEDNPYVLEFQNGDQLLEFYGSVHTGDESHPQLQQLDQAWKIFVNSPNRRKIVYFEGHQQPPRDMEEKDALQKYGESGLIAKRALDARMPSESPEPDRKQELEQLVGKFGLPKTITYYFGRQMHQWNRQDRQNEPDWQKYAQNLIKHWSELEVDLDKTLSWYKDVTGKEFDPEDEETLYAVSDPFQSEVSAESGKLRDEHLFAKIKQTWQMGYDIFVIYGSGHVIKLEPALTELTAKTKVSHE